MLLSIIKYKENVLKDSLSKKYLNVGLISTPNIRMYRFQPPIDRGLGGTQYASVFNSACQTQALSLNDNDTPLCDIMRYMYLVITVDDKLSFQKHLQSVFIIVSHKMYIVNGVLPLLFERTEDISLLSARFREGCVLTVFSTLAYCS